MANKLSLQKDIMDELLGYSDRIILGAETVIEELRGDKKSDTDELLNLVIQGINWEIEVFNSCESLINEKELLIDKNKMAESVVKLGSILKDKDYIKIAACLDVDFLPFIKTMQSSALTISRQ